MKVLVTGGAGFIGSHLCEEFLKRGHEVICVDNLITGSNDNILHLKNNPNFKFLNHDVSEELPGDLKVDQIYHLASPASPNKLSSKSYLSHPFETMRVNTDGTWNLANLATKLNAKFLFASTSEVYGDPKEHPQKEEYNGNVDPTGPRAVYDEAKRFGETITSALIREKNLDGRIMRIFNTYGERMALDDGRVVIQFVTQALEGKPLTVYGDGTQTRSFIYISDLIDGIIAAMENPNAKGDVFNLGNPNEISVLDLANKVKQITGSSSPIEFKDLPEDDPKRRSPDISKAREKLGWEPKVNLEEGLSLLIKYLRHHTLDV